MHALGYTGNEKMEAGRRPQWPVKRGWLTICDWTSLSQSQTSPANFENTSGVPPALMETEPGTLASTRTRIHPGSCPGKAFARKRPESESDGSELRDCELDHVAFRFCQPFARHRFDHRPVLPEKLRRVLKVRRLHFDAAGLPSTLVRDLKVKGVTDRLPIAV